MSSDKLLLSLLTCTNINFILYKYNPKNYILGLIENNITLNLLLNLQNKSNKLTMKHKKIIISGVFLLLGLTGLQAQENSTAAGGEATGSGGTASYSVGQIAYTTLTGTTGTVSGGVQQPYEISPVRGINETSINLVLSVYPNPTTDFLTLKVEKTEGLTMQLYDLQGRVITSKTIKSNATDISLEAQPQAIYFLKVVKNNTLVKTFKIIKN